MWLINLFVTLISIIIVILIVIQIFRTIYNIVKVMGAAVEKIPEKQIQTERMQAESKGAEAVEHITHQDPNTISDVLNQWTENPDEPNSGEQVQ